MLMPRVRAVVPDQVTRCKSTIESVRTMHKQKYTNYIMYIGIFVYIEAAPLARAGFNQILALDDAHHIVLARPPPAFARPPAEEVAMRIAGARIAR